MPVGIEDRGRRAESGVDFAQSKEDSVLGQKTLSEQRPI